MSVLTVIGYAFAIVGASIFLAAALGLRRFRDPYSRISAVATAAGVGVAFVTIGVVLTHPTLDNVIKVVIAVALQLVTSALGAIIIARAAVNSGYGFSPDTDIQELGSAPPAED